MSGTPAKTSLRPFAGFAKTILRKESDEDGICFRSVGVGTEAPGELPLDHGLTGKMCQSPFVGD